MQSTAENKLKDSIFKAKEKYENTYQELQDTLNLQFLLNLHHVPYNYLSNLHIHHYTRILPFFQEYHLLLQFLYLFL